MSQIFDVISADFEDVSSYASTLLGTTFADICLDKHGRVYADQGHHGAKADVIPSTASIRDAAAKMKELDVGAITMCDSRS